MQLEVVRLAHPLLQDAPQPAAAASSSDGGAGARVVIAVMCTTFEADLIDLKRSLELLNGALGPDLARTPVAVFHEDMNHTHFRELQAASAGRTTASSARGSAQRSSPGILDLRFVRIAFELPAQVQALARSGSRWVRHWTGNMRARLPGWRTHRHGVLPYRKRGTFGYYHMCRFWAGAGFALPFFDEFGYVMRIDSDSTCTMRLPPALFATMAAEGVHYMFAVEGSDGGDVIEGLWLAALAYARSRSAAAEEAARAMRHRKLVRSPNCSAAPPGALSAGAAGERWARTAAGEQVEVLPCEDELFTQLPIYYTNFEVASLAFLRSAPYRAWFDFVDGAGGMYAHRWGDAPIRWLGVQMHLNATQVRRLPQYCRHP